MRTVRASDAQLAPAEVVHVARPLAPLLGKLIRDTRAWHDMSMHELARRVGCSEGYIGLIELHGRIPRPAMLKKFADVLDLDWQYLAELARHAPEEQSLTDWHVLHVPAEAGSDARAFLALPARIRRRLLRWAQELQRDVEDEDAVPPALEMRPSYTLGPTPPVERPRARRRGRKKPAPAPKPGAMSARLQKGDGTAV